MKWALLLLMLLICVPVIRAQDGLNAAVAACTNGDFAAGTALLEAAASAGARNGNLYYDLGLCYAGAGQTGKALVNFLRAARYLPRDDEVNAQIDRLRANRADLPEDETDALTLAGTLTDRLMTTTELAMLALIVWSGFFVLLIFYRLRPAWQSSLRAALLTMALILTALLILLSSRFYVDSNRPSAVIVSPAVQAMSGPRDDYLRLFMLEDAAELRILESRNGWHRVALPGGRQGWIRQEAAEIVKP